MQAAGLDDLDMDNIADMDQPIMRSKSKMGISQIGSQKGSSRHNDNEGGSKSRKSKSKKKKAKKEEIEEPVDWSDWVSIKW